MSKQSAGNYSIWGKKYKIQKYKIQSFRFSFLENRIWTCLVINLPRYIRIINFQIYLLKQENKIAYEKMLFYIFNLFSNIE